MEQEINFLEEMSDFIFISKYARYNEKENRRETLSETVDRVCDMHLQKYFYLPEEDKQKIISAFQMVKEKKIVPSMRSMQFGGQAILAHNSRIYNCFSKETEFITNKGVKKFSDFKENDEIIVLTHLGNWKKAIVKKYGIQEVYPITITRAKSKFTVKVTKDHRWLLKNGKETISLNKKDLLLGAKDIFSKFEYDNSSIEERLYWCYGFVYGDGTKVKNKKGEYTYSMVRLCDDKIKYSYRFEELGFSSSSSLSLKGDIIFATGKYLKTLPDLKIDSPDLIKAFVRGYLDADGRKTKNFTENSSIRNLFTSIVSTSKESIEFIKNIFPVAGMYIVSETIYDNTQTNYGKPSYSRDIRIFNSPNNQSNSNTPFVVSNSWGEDKNLISKEEVWCLEVEDDHSFVFPNGLVTGNCGVRHIDSLRAFSEFFYCLLSGTGMTGGVSNKVICNLPNLVSKSDKTGTVLTYVIEDSIEGWSDSVEALLMCYHQNTPFTGRKIIFDYSKIRPKGSPLKTGGGKAPGFEGLRQAHLKIKELLDHLIEDLYLTQLRSIDIYDILMHTADAVLSGGIRRAATAIIFDYNDELMMNAKTNFKVSSFKRFEKINDKWEGTVIVKKKKYEVNISDWEYQLLQDKKEISWFHCEPQRARSNNSALLIRNKVTKEQFEKMVDKTKEYGEPGFVFTDNELSLYNPCFEISFIPKTKDGRYGVQFCNLTEINGGKIESLEDWKLATEAATILGTIQAGYTHFPYLSKAAKELTEEEALLGVSVTGWFDKPEILLNDKNQYMMAKLAIRVNEIWSEKIGINKAARVTCVKPSGTASTFFGTSSGIHPHHARQYFRRVQMNKLDNIYQFFKEVNPHATEESVWSNTKSDDVITFPITVNDKAILKEDLSAIEHLSYIKRTQENWVIAGTSPTNEKNITHNISSTVLVKENEWQEVIEYLFENRNYFAAVSLLPNNGDVIYAQAPFQKVTENDLDKWNELVNNWKHINWSLFNEESDNTKLSETLACAGGACEIT